MALSITIAIAVPLDDLWRELSDLAHHVTWMKDAESIEFLGDQRRGVGTTMRCRTRVGPLVTNDLMTVTRWEKHRAIAVRHEGVVRGEGLFSVREIDAGTTELTWSERLVFPWWALGPLGAVAARPVLRRVWRGNLRRLSRGLVNGG